MFRDALSAFTVPRYSCVNATLSNTHTSHVHILPAICQHQLLLSQFNGAIVNGNSGQKLKAQKGCGRRPTTIQLSPQGKQKRDSGQKPRAARGRGTLNKRPPSGHPFAKRKQLEEEELQEAEHTEVFQGWLQLESWVRLQLGYHPRGLLWNSVPD
ncbi:hypothetical protein B0H19DRAFT_1083189 [Mycena capillaripes]|nr:hypothetical protein B0H19DRAFT_1083189 [Mycena capillaripes]